MKLYEIDKEIEDILIELEVLETTPGLFGDFLGRTKKKLNELKIEREIKIENFLGYIKSLEYEAAILKEEKDKLAQKQKTKESRIEWLKEYLLEIVEKDFEGKYKSPLHSASIRSYEAVEAGTANIHEEAPEQYTRIKKEPNKILIKEDLKNGATIPGWYLATRKSLVIR